MNIIEQSVRLLPVDTDIIHAIASAARVCYKSEDMQSVASDTKLVSNLITNGHTAMLEHASVVMKANIRGYVCVHQMAEQAEKETGAYGLYSRTKQLYWDKAEKSAYIVMNCRDLMHLVNYIRGKFDTHTVTAFSLTDIITGDWVTSINEAMELTGDDAVRYVPPKAIPLHLLTKPHFRHTAVFTVDRAVANEFVRHRCMSFAQESTRYCDYRGGISFVRPMGMPEGSVKIWEQEMEAAEMVYRGLRATNIRPEIARAVLPLSTATTLVMTGDKEDWKRFFDLRLRGIYGTPHPMAKQAAEMLHEEFVAMFGEAGNL